LIAAKETWELVETLDWPEYVFWFAVVGMALVAFGSSALATVHLNRETAARS
jgi:hypothetical protein